jgi:hypothetical protein
MVEDHVSDRLSVVADDQRFYTALLCHIGSTRDRVLLCRMHH